MTRFATQSRPGHKHTVNEDTTGNLAKSGLWLIADGMGGEAAGEIASDLVCSTILEEARSGAALPEAVASAHRAVASAAAQDAGKTGMGSTVVAVRLGGDQMEVAWVGDSRCYLWREGKLHLITRDHSLVQHLVDTGQITETEAATHPERNVVTQVLGVGDPRPDTAQLSLQANDWLLLCSDGLNDVLTDAEIRTVLADSADPSYAAQHLVDRVADAQGPDDVTVTVVHNDPRSGNPWLAASIGIVLGLLVFAIAIWTDAL